MKWLDKIISDIVKKLNIKILEIIEVHSKEISKLNKNFDDIERRLNSDEENNGLVYLSINKEISNLHEHMDNQLRRNNLKIDEKESQLRQEFEIAITGLTKNFDKKFELLGDKKGIVTTLLKRIAELEGLVEDVHK